MDIRLLLKVVLYLVWGVLLALALWYRDSVELLGYALGCTVGLFIVPYIVVVIFRAEGKAYILKAIIGIITIALLMYSRGLLF